MFVLGVSSNRQRRWRFVLAALVAVWATLTLAPAAHAQSSGGFISPGELAADHQELSGLTGCLSCHTVGAGVSDAKCLDCHDSVRRQVSARTGFHADKGKACASCHPDHRGVDFPLVRMDTSTFDHRPTGFPLVGEHATTACKDCHETPGVWTGADAACSACHDTPHGVDAQRPELADCARCHTSRGWDAIPLAIAVFDHMDAAQADYALHGQHGKVACEKCHDDWKFVPVRADTCADCHADPHSRQFGARPCDDCHTVDRDAFALRDYDHRSTGFPLVGPHKKVSCEDCHGDGKRARYVGLPHDTCETCHRDPHDGQFRPRGCDACHLPTASSFALAGFDHGTTGFPLRNAHAEVGCDACHGEGAGGTFAGLEAGDCIACHEDTHDARFAPSACTTCHTDGTWAVEVFDHARTDFALFGAHTTVPCAGCHGEGDARVLHGLAFGSCADCHADEDPHQSVTTATCTSCHETVDWSIVSFAHGQVTEFPLTGKHVDVACKDCHTDPAFGVDDASCEACHEADRPTRHFDGACTTCHLPDGWLPATLGVADHAGTGFALHGAHAAVACADCHDGAATAAPFCIDCHADDDPHRNQLGNRCDDCHSPTDWFLARFNHATTGWPLRGVHQTATCADCHATGYVGTPTTCRRCHEEDRPGDVMHRDPLASDCELCHRPYAWEPARSPHGED